MDKNFQVIFFSETGFLLGASKCQGESEGDVIAKVEKQITSEKTIKAYPYGESISLGCVIMTSKIASFTINEN